MKINKNLVLRSIAGEHMLIPVGEQTAVTNGMITLTPVAALIWTELSEGASCETVLQKILDRFEVDEATAKTDLDAFLQQMRAADLLEM